MDLLLIDGLLKSQTFVTGRAGSFCTLTIMVGALELSRLTQNKMFVSSAAAGRDMYDMRKMDKLEKTNSFKHLVATAFLCNNASFMEESESAPIALRKGIFHLFFP